jgi:hypothetical protein
VVVGEKVMEVSMAIRSIVTREQFAITDEGITHTPTATASDRIPAIRTRGPSIEVGSETSCQMEKITGLTRSRR